MDYPAAARVIGLYLSDFCDGSLPYPQMIADAARWAADYIDKLKSEILTLKELDIVSPHNRIDDHQRSKSPRVCL
jgi:hypothetical protein